MSRSDGANQMSHRDIALRLPYPSLLNLSLTELRFHTLVEDDSVDQPVTASVPCGLIISAQKPLQRHWSVATHNKSLPRTSEIEMGISVT